VSNEVEPVDLPYGLPSVDYTEYSNRQLLVVPLGVLALALTILVVWSTMVTASGAPVALGTDFTGGTDMKIQTDASKSEVESTFPAAESVAGVAGEADSYVLTFPPSEDVGEIESTAQDAGYEVQYVQSRSAAFGQESQVQALAGVLIAFAGMSIVVFLLFRTFVPSVAVVASAFSDIVIPLAAMNLLGMKLSLGTVAALLMLIGYSVDSDLLLNNHILRRRGAFYESAYRAMRTGVTMTLTSISALIVMTLVASFFRIPLMPAIGTVLIIGLAADLMNTYMLNMSLLRWYKYEGVAR